MDRVLLIIDDIQFNRQFEMTLRKVGFEVESVNNEFAFNEPLLSFNPDYIIVRGNSARLSVLNVGKKLKENTTHNKGKVILIFPENVTLTGEDLFKIRSDIILNDPISTLRLVLYLISISGQDMEIIKEKLMKYALTDSQFRINEQLILKNAGITLDSEIEMLSNMDVLPPSMHQTHSEFGYIPDLKDRQEDSSNMLILKADAVIETEAMEILKNETAQPATFETKRISFNPSDYQVTETIKDRITDEVRLTKDELPLRIDTYNHAIKNVDQDLNKGLKKRQTKKEFNQLHKDLMNEKKTDKNAEQDLDNERMRFTKAMFKK
jgi:hypothetical protein